MGARRRRRRRPVRRVRRWVRRQDRFTRRLLLAVSVLGLFVLVLSSLPALTPPRPPPGGPSPAPPASRAAKSRPTQASRPAPRPAPRRPEPPVARRTPPPRAPVPGSSPSAAIVIDDLGRTVAQLRDIAAIGVPVTIAVLPRLDDSERTAREARELGIETLLHLPMEPVETDRDPGPGALRTGMPPARVRALLREHVAAVPGAVGVNNHMGSRFTADPDSLAPFMEELKGLGLFWLDSRTTPGSRGAEIARAHGIPVLERDIFLDAELSPESIRAQVRRLVKAAKRRGTAIGIGHPHPETIAVLHELREELNASGVELVPLSALVRRAQAAAEPPALAAAAPR